jgi:hypothetical protein
MNLGGEREDSAPITGEIGNLAEEIIPVEANETPQIKENHPEASGASPESPIPQVPSIQAVSLILPSHASSVPVQLVSQSQPGSASTGRILGSPGRSQAGPLGFILIRTTGPAMASQGGSIARYPEFWGKGDEDVEQHWFLCEAIWRSRGTPDANKLVEFQTTLRGHTLKWYMNIIEPGVPGTQGQAFTLGQVRMRFIAEFKLPQSEQQALSELHEIQQREGESAWEYNQKFKDAIGRLAHPIHEEHQREWYIQGLLPLTQIPLTQQRIATLTDALEQSMKIEAMAGYPGSLRITRPPVDVNLVQLQGKISTLTENIQELTIPRPGRPQVWCTGCYTEGHLVNECP